MGDSSDRVDGVVDECHPGVAAHLRTALEEPTPISVRVWEIADKADASREEAEACLEALSEAGVLNRVTTHECSKCGSDLSSGELDEGVCPECLTALVDAEPRTVVRYTRPGQRTRDTRWVFAIHGMNTHGAWQQDFSWLLTKAYGYSVPVFIYKYGRAVVSPLLSLRQQRYAQALSADLGDKMQEMSGTPYGNRPDIIAHSFGTWLLARVLEGDPDIKVGRIILTGSIIRPNFNWSRLFERDQVEAVLCHSGGKDFWVRLAPYAIPSAGPSGSIGFNSRDGVQWAHSVDFKHSDYFTPANLSRLLTTTWASFLTTPTPSEWIPESDLMPPRPPSWSPGFRHVGGHALKYLAILIVTVAIIFIAMSIWLGAGQLLSSILSP